MCSASRRCTAQCRVSKICAKRFVSPQSLPLVNLQDKPTRQRDKLARNRDSGTAKSRDACASTTFPYGLRARCEYFCSAHRGTSPAFGAAIRGAIDSWSESLRAGIACAAKRHAHSLQISFSLLPTLTSHWYFRCQENFICLVLCLRPGHGPGCDGC